jgi:bifunctional DNA-binding transcriptional regulator/antitoxin component of YhaV-PrlF toxin-antitoxin module
MTHTLKVFNSGQITLPKTRRSKFNTKNFTATETKEWLLIKPILDNNSTIYYEDKDGFGIYAPEGIDPTSIISSIKNLHTHG